MRLSLKLLKESSRKFKLAIAGGGSGGNAIAQYFSRTIAVSEIAVIDPSEKIHYQPGYSLIGSGLMDPKEVEKARKEFHPDLVEWYQKEVKSFEPQQNKVVLSDGFEVEYDFLVISTGAQPRFDKIEGLTEAFKTPGVCSVYDYDLSKKTYDELNNFKGGTALFTHPSGHIKGASATQEICYVADDIFRKNKVRDNTAIIYNTALESLFENDQYADAMNKIMKEKNIVSHTLRNLKKVDSSNKVAYFDVLDNNGKSTGKTEEVQYHLLHVGPPCLPIQACLDAAKSSNGLTDSEGWIAVDPETLQSRKYKNVFGLGDCISGPTSGKTAAATSKQFSVVRHNVESLMNDREMTYKYDGYSAYPVMIDQSHAMLAEFDYDGQQKETLPIKQAKSRYLFYQMEKNLLPFIYWKLLMKGFWQGPDTIRKLMHAGMGK